jgi:hypothetical protein
MTALRQHVQCRGVLLLMLLGCCAAGHADNAASLAEAAGLARAGNFAPAWCIWERLAKQGDVEALFNMGWLYRNGQGVARDDMRARELWEQAGSKGHAEAQMALGMLYADSRPPGPDPGQAIRWFQAAAGQGIEDALLILLDYMDRDDAAAVAAVGELVRGGQVGTAVNISADEANVRARPSTDARVLLTLPAGARVVQLEARKNWWRVWVWQQGVFGWMHRSLFD